ncbi:MAG: hypothetical protein J0I14_01760 [Propionibacteriaceae bacterium]|jgi:hypothetical protein|nr:hypothetical protein [Propionibacteriaceae bacterium]
MSIASQPKPNPEWPSYPDANAGTPGQQVPDHDHDHAVETGTKHGGHGWMMALMCLPLIAIGLWQWVSGAGFGSLLGGLACFGMMAAMHLGMGRSSHRH